MRISIIVRLVIIVAVSPTQAMNLIGKVDSDMSFVYSREQKELNANDGKYFKSKSERAATLISLIATTLPSSIGAFRYEEVGRTASISLVSSGIIAGPSLGYLYGGVMNHAAEGIALRAGIIGAGAWLGSIGNWTDSGNTFPALLILTGAGIVIYSAGHDIARVSKWVREKNLSMAGHGHFSISIMPRYFANNRTTGVELNLLF
jgi:hypothetical protein